MMKQPKRKKEKKKALDILFLQSFFVFRGCLSNALGEDRSAFTVNLALLVLLFIYLFTYGLHKICIYMHMYMYLVIVLHCSLFFFDLISFVLGFFFLFISPLQFSAISCLNGTFLVPQFKALLCELKKKKKVNYLSPYRQTVYLFKQSTGSFFLFELKHITRF